MRKYLLDDSVYEETKNIVLGKIEKNPLLIELSDWFLSTFAVRILNIHFTKPTLIKSNKYVLSIIFESSHDYQKMYHEPYHIPPRIEEYVAQIKEEFRQLALKYQYATESQLASMFINYYDFAQETKTDINHKAIRELIIQIKEKYGMVWNISSAGDSGPVVFYYSDKDITENMTNGISKMIAEDCFLILKKYDELDFLTRENMDIKFDSKEHVDLNFQGSLFYYFK